MWFCGLCYTTIVCVRAGQGKSLPYLYEILSELASFVRVGWKSPTTQLGLFLWYRLLRRIRCLYPSGLQSNGFQPFPRKLSPFILNTVASSKIRSTAHRRESSTLKLFLRWDGCLLLVKTMLELPSLLYLRSMRSKNSCVLSLSNSRWPTSLIMRQEGRTDRWDRLPLFRISWLRWTCPETSSS